MTQLKGQSDRWDAAAYVGRHGFVWRLADDVIHLLDPRPGERILDVGSGTGHLTAQIAQAGASVVGIDSSLEMVAKAQQNYPEMDFRCADIRSFVAPELFDAVFSNATLHWVGKPELTAARIREALRPGGRFVAEFGARGNIRSIVEAAQESRAEIGAHQDNHRNPWYFPSADEYREVLHKSGFKVHTVRELDRPTRLEDGESGLENWMRVLGGRLLAGLSDSEATTLIKLVCDRLRPTLFERGSWIADYRRIRVAAVRLPQT